MKTIATLAATTVLALSLAAPAFAQNTITGVRQLDDRIDDIDRDARRDLGRQNDAARFGENGVVQGFRGSAALTASGTDDTADLSLAGRLTYGQGSWNHLVGFAAEYGEADGESDEEEFFLTYEGSRFFTPTVYAYGTGRYQYDNQTDNRQDAFLGLGLGYRVYNTEQVAWRVQGGPGIRYIEDQVTRDSETEAAALISSRFYYAFSDTVSLTNDTDILGSSSDYNVSNDFGVNFKVNDTLSTRISYNTEYDSDPSDGIKSTDNTVGISLVVGF
ncbi:DUF481 domain-containing protein [Jannaschia donghaensis]|uniref:Putative salt-induced outer membrane protein n=1 Tax=Jannaschia donghaensis TaxID=420998 RepID=A0A0M6YGY4_9RHOB|nr:DUF481 domain-containing protein [Jannaschia donghaensis]CTQ49608.1 Putative salt-induced outer membrane protein [Jannaschia donghaensis]